MVTRFGSHLIGSRIAQWLDPKRPLEGSQLLEFYLSVVGSSLAAQCGGDEPEEKVTALWSLVRAGGCQNPQCVPWDRVECLYKQDSGISAPPAWLASIPFFQRVMEEDKAWHNIQAQWGIHGFTVGKSLIKLEAPVNTLLACMEDPSASSQEALSDFKNEVNEAVTTTLVHAFCMAGRYFNEISTC